MTLNCVFCGNDLCRHSEGKTYACMRSMAENKSLRLLIRILQFLGVVNKN